jgi:DNA polymerase-3 subunit gamma/tau
VPPTVPAATPQPEAGAQEAAPQAAPTRRVDPSAIASARGAIQGTRPHGQAPQERQPTVSDDDVDPDDPDADDHVLGGAQLLERELGARIIEEIRHD